MNPILLDIPMPIVTERLIIREPRVGEGKVVNDAIAESFAGLHAWMPWAATMPSVEESEIYTRQSVAKFIERREFALRIWNRDQTRFLGSTGLHVKSWEPRVFEIGYWIRTSEAGRGLMTEAVTAVTAFGFDVMKAVRI